MRLTPSAISIAVPACPFSKWRGEGTVEIRCSGAAATIPAGTPSRRFLVHARDCLGPEKIRRSETEDREDDDQTYARARAPEKTFDAQQLPRGPVTKISASFCSPRKKRRTRNLTIGGDAALFSPVLTSRISAIKALGSILPSLRGRDLYTLPVTHTSRCTL